MSGQSPHEILSNNVASLPLGLRSSERMILTHGELPLGVWAGVELSVEQGPELQHGADRHQQFGMVSIDYRDLGRLGLYKFL